MEVNMSTFVQDMWLSLKTICLQAQTREKQVYGW